MRLLTAIASLLSLSLSSCTGATGRDCDNPMHHDQPSSRPNQIVYELEMGCTLYRSSHILHIGSDPAILSNGSTVKLLACDPSSKKALVEVGVEKPIWLKEYEFVVTQGGRITVIAIAFDHAEIAVEWTGEE